MSNPLSNPQASSWLERIFATTRIVLRRVHGVGGGVKLSNGAVIGLVVCALLVGGISLAALGREGSTKSEATTAASASSATKSKATLAKAERKSKEAAAEKAASAANEKGETARAAQEENESGEAGEPDPKPQGSQNASGASAKASENEAESSELVRARGAWFHDQRAYPFDHIPSGALQKAIQDRDLMKQRQKAAAAGAQSGANAVISFPGDALWHLTGPQPIDEPFSVNSGFPTASGRVTAIAVDPSDATGQTVYVGGAAGGVWKTTNGGTSWTALTDAQPSLSIGSIAVDPDNHNTIYIGTGEENFSGDAYYGAGILKSTDGGLTWTQMGASTFAQVLGPQTGGALIGGIAVQPGNSSIVLAAVSFFVNNTTGGIYRSTDAGVTWTEDAAPQGEAATGVVFESTSNGGATATAWAAMGDIFGQAVNGIYKSTDSGLTWTKQTSALPTVNVGRITLGYAPNTSGLTATVYAAIANSSVSSNDLLGFFKTTDGGTTWSQLGSTPAFCNHQCWYDVAVAVNPGNANFVVVGGGAFTNNSSSLFKSTDGGGTWTNSTPGSDFTLGTTSVRPHVDTHAFAFAPNGTTPRFYVGNDGGVWRTDDPTQTPPLWVDLNTTLAITQFYPGPSAGIGDENYGFGGTQDNDTEVFSGTLDWTNVFACGDGGFTAIDPQIPTTVYTGCDRLAGTVVQKSVFNGASLSFNPADSGIVRTDRAQFIPPLTIDQSNPTTLYFGTCRVFQTIDGAATWNPISGDLSAGNAPVTTTCPGTGSITSMDVAHQSSSIILAGTNNGKVWETTTGGASWNQIDGGLLPARHVTTVRTKRNDSTGMIAYVTFSGFGSCAGCGSTPGHVFKTTNGGATWTNISGDLPDAPVNDLIVDHSGNPTFDTLYIATDVGVFSCPNPEAGSPCANWTVVGDGLPNSPVLGLAMRRSSHILRAFTHGRSAWHIQLTDQTPPAVAALSSITPAAVNVGDPTTLVTFTGLNFSTNTLVLFDGVSVGTPTFVNTTQLTVNVSSSLFTDGHVFQVSITDPAGADTGSGPFTVMNPVLNAFNMSPISTTTYTPVTLVFTGTNFVNGTSVTFNNVPLTGGTVTGGGTGFNVPVPASLLTTAGLVNVTITNPLPGGGPTPSFSFSFTINTNPNALAIVNPSPIVLGPVNLAATTAVMNVSITNPGGALLNITAQSITGTNAANFSFAAPTVGSSCNFPTSGQTGIGTVTLAAGTGTCNFGITFTAGTPPGLAISNATLNITDTAAGSPQATSIIGLVNVPLVLLTPVNFGAVGIGTTSPTMNSTLFNGTPVTVNVSAAGFTLSGTNKSDFQIVPTAAGGNPPCPTASFPLAPNGFCDVGVAFIPSVAGNETATLNVSDDGPGSPQNAPLFGIGVELTSISPSIVATGGPAFTLTVNGGGFAPSAVVNVNGSARLTTFVSANQLLASIPASDIATAGNLAISVTTPVPGGTPSEPKTLVVAQAPSATNDDINFAITVSATPFRITEDTTQATVNTGGVNDPAVSCASNSVARSVWFKFVAPATGRVVADTKFARYLTILSAWTGTPGSLVAVAGACASGNITFTSPAQTFIGFPVTNGTTYFLMVTDASGTGPGGTLTFSLDFANAAPANDDFNNAINASPAPFTNTVNSILATTDTGTRVDPTPSCTVGAPGLAASGKGNTVWYKFTAPANGTITADTLTSPYNTILTAVTGAPGSFTEVACNDNAVINSTVVAPSLVSFLGTSGTTYFFMVSAFIGDGGTTNFHLTFTPGAGAPAVTFNLANVAFGNQKVATTSATTNVQLTNSGSATLNVTSITKTGTDPTQFAIVAPTSGTACSPLTGPFNLNAGISCFFGVQFAPTTTGAKSASVSVADNATGSPQTVPLTGTGAVPVAALAPANIPFGSQTIATTSATTDVTVSNTGLVSMSITSITKTSTDTTQFALVAPTAGTPCPLGASTLNAGTSCTVGVQFAPTTLGAKSASVSVADDAAGSPQTVPLTGTGVSAPAPVVTLNPTSIPFGNQKVGTTSAALNATLTNTGNANLNITGVSITGTNVADFTSSGTTCTGTTVLAATQSCTLGATFTPGAQGARSAAFTITDNASGSPHSLPLSGTGTIPGVGLAPTNITFGNLPINTTSATTNVTLTNSGVASLNITGITLTGTDTAQFTLGAPTSGTACPLGASNLAAGANCAVGVKFAPTTTGAKSASVSFVDDASGSPQAVPLTGTGTTPGITFAPTNIPFGSQRTGTSTATTNVTITNSGTATLNITSITLTGANPAQFTLGAPTNGTACVLGVNALTAGNSCNVGVKFSPTNTGAQSANMSVADDAAGGPQTVPLTGTGTVPVAGLAPANIPFGNQTIATSSATTDVTLTNTGLAQLNLTSITLTGTDTTQFTLGAPTTGTACPLGASNLAAGANCKVGVKFSPTTTGAKSASVSFADDAAGSPQTVPLTGTGVTATVTLNPALAFGNQRKGTSSAAMTVTLTNTGSVAVHLAASNSITFSGVNAADFTTAAPSSGTPCSNGATVAASGGACTIGVVFSPSTAGAEAATLDVADDAPGSPQTNNLTGSGIFPQATPSPSPVNFNNQVINTTSGVMAVTLTNGGTDVLHLAASNAAVLGGANGSDFAVAAGTTCTNGATVNTGANCVINLTFTPGALNARTATLTITDDASPTTQAVTLNGTGTNPAPAITSLSPASATAGGAPFTLTVNGTGFVNGAVVNFNGAAKTTAFVSATQVTAAILAADIATAATVNVTVTNPAPGGGTSAAATFTINNPLPTITTLSPTSATAGSAAFTLTVNGTNFVSTSVVNFNGAAKTTTFVNVTQLTAAIAAADIAAGGTLPVTVTNAAPGGGTSAPTNFIVNNPLPTITSLAPSSATAGGAAFTLTVNGTGFVTGQSLVKFNGNAKTTTVVSATQVTATITAVDIATAGTFPVTVTNAAPGGGTSVPTNFTVNNPAPTITTLSPSSAIAGGTAFTLTVNGTNFVAASVVNFNGAARTTTFGSATQAMAAITAADIATAGTPSVTVTNPAPGGGTSAGATFTINNAQPVLSTLSPASAAAGGAAFTLTVNGSKFVNNAVVSFNGNAKATTFGSAAQLTAAITAADIATGGAFNVIVTNPAPTVGPSAALTFNVNNPSPTVTNATVGGKTHASGGAALAMTIAGTNFVSTSVVNFGGKAEPTTFVSATQITAAIPASDVATAGNVNVTVTNPTPGGGTSSASTFTVDGFTVSGPANTPVKAGQPAMITITVTPSANGFFNPVSFTVAGLPAHTTATFNPTTVTPSAGVQTTTLTIMTTARGAAPPSAPVDTPVSPLLRLLPVLWLAAILAGLYAMQLLRRTPQRRRYAAAVPLALLLVTGAVLAGCAGGKSGTPAGAAQLTITATSGTLVQTTPANSVTLTVQ